MSKIDEKYITALEKFTDALDEVVKTLKSQQKTGKADTVNEMLKSMPVDKITTVIKNLKKTTEKGFKDLKEQNKIITKKIEGIKQQKESGMFDRVEDPKNKNKIVDGIKVVILIAAGVLALGMAFKLIGKVDFMSVMALSVAMVAMAVAFSKVAETKNLSFSKIFKVAMIFPIMGLSLVLSAWFLKDFPKISLQQGLSIIFVAGALGLATFLVVKAISNINSKSILMIPLVPILLPLIALGLVKASHILTGIKQISMQQVLSVALIGLALGVAMIGITFALKFMKNVSWKELLVLPIMIPLIAGGIVIASRILQDFIPIKNPLQLLVGSFVIGLSLLAFAPAIWIIGKLGLKEIAKGALGILAIAGTILGVAWIFSKMPTIMKYPEFMWTLGAGLSILAFGVISLGIGFLSSNPATAAFFWIGIPAMLVVAGSMVLVAAILATGNYDKYPSLDWAIGAGGSLLIFSLAAVAASVGGLAGAIGSLFTGGEDPLVKMANTMVLVSLLLQKGTWNIGYPSHDWALGVGTALLMFSGAYVAITALEGFNRVFSFLTGGKSKSFDQFVISAIGTMIVAREMLNVGDWNSAKHPTTEWSLGVGTALAMFASAYAVITGIEGIGRVFTFFTGGKSKSFDQFVLSATKSMGTARDNLIGDWGDSKHPTVEWSLGVGTALAMFASAYAVITGIEGIGRVFTFFTGGKSQSFNEFVSSASKSMGIARDNLKGNWNTTSFPSKDWADGVGLSLLLFARSYAIISGVPNFMDKTIKYLTGNNEDPFNTFVVSASNTMISARNILSGAGPWNAENSYPSKEFVNGVGGMLIIMASAYSKFNSMGFFDTISAIFGKKISLDAFVVSASKAIVNASTILGKGNYTKLLPDKIYLDSFEYFIAKISDVISNFQDDIDLDSIQLFNTGFRIIMSTLNVISNANYKNFPDNLQTDKLVYFIIKSAYSTKDLPSPETFLNFNIGMSYFVAGINKLSTLKPLPTDFISSFDKFLEFMNKMPDKSTFFSDKYDNMNQMAKSVSALAKSFSELNSAMSSFLNMSKGLFLISIIDEVRLGHVLNSIQKHQAALKIVSRVPEEQTNLLSVIKALYETLPGVGAESAQNKEIAKGIEDKETERKKQEKFYNDISDIKGLLYQLLDGFDKPTQAGSFHK
jgi:hypothetical protein